MAKEGRLIKVKGLDNVIKNMDRYDKKLSKTIDLEARKLVVSIVADGQKNAPVDTGFLRSNIRVQVKRDSYKAVSHANYSIPVDKRKPFFTLQALKKVSKFGAKIKSIIAGI